MQSLNLLPTAGPLAVALELDALLSSAFSPCAFGLRLQLGVGRYRLVWIWGELGHGAQDEVYRGEERVACQSKNAHGRCSNVSGW